MYSPADSNGWAAHSTRPAGDSLELMEPAALEPLIRDARYIAVLTGSGVSAESGIPTFREAQTGLWARYRPEELATPEAFVRWPDRVWEWYAWRRSLVEGAEPNPAHSALAELDALVPRLTLVTQNVDGLHQRAGSRDVIELHGNIMRTKCSAENRVVADWRDTGTVPPSCPDCRAPLRPDVVWFGEALPVHELNRAHAAAVECDVFLAVGTSGIVHPAAGLPLLAHAQGAHVVVVNPDTDVPLLSLPGVIHLAGSAAAVLPALVAAVAGADRVAEAGEGN